MLTEAGDASCPLSLQRSTGTSSASDSLEAVISSIAASLLAIASSVLAFSASLLARSLSPHSTRCRRHPRQSPVLFEVAQFLPPDRKLRQHAFPCRVCPRAQKSFCVSSSTCSLPSTVTSLEKPSPNNALYVPNEKWLTRVEKGGNLAIAIAATQSKALAALAISIPDQRECGRTMPSIWAKT